MRTFKPQGTYTPEWNAEFTHCAYCGNPYEEWVIGYAWYDRKTGLPKEIKFFGCRLAKNAHDYWLIEEEEDYFDFTVAVMR